MRTYLLVEFGIGHTVERCRVAQLLGPKERESNTFRAPAYKRADIGMSYRLFDNHEGDKKSILRNVWLGLDCLNLFGINNVNSYYWITDVTGQQYAVPNYLTGRQINGRITIEF